MNNESVESYLRHGCGRCDRFKTPECNVHRWPDALHALRELLLASGMEEAMKWGSPCYRLDGKNVVMLISRNDHCALSFLRGGALDDKHGVLVAPGPNSRYARSMKFASVHEVMEQRAEVTRLIENAMAVRRAGTQVPKGAPEPIPAELAERLAGDAKLKEAFEALTPGRQRSHILHVGGAKQSATRARRVEKCAPIIFAGKGFNER